MTTKLLNTFEMVGNTFGRPANRRPVRAMTQAVSGALGPAMERLEDRWLMSSNTSIQPLAGSVSAATLAAAPQTATLSASKSLIVFNSVATGHTGAAASPTESITITNTGTATLTFGTNPFSIVNDPSNATQDAALFKIVNLSSLPGSLAPGQSFKIQLNYTAKAVGRNAALLQIISNDPANPTTNIQVHGIGTSGVGGTNEPSLTRILRSYNIPTQVGELETDTLYPVTPDAPTQEVPMQLLEKAGPGRVTITDLADFTDQTNPAYRFGFYDPANPAKLTELFYIDKADSQSTNPTPQGATQFDPGTTPFGLYFQSPLKDNGEPRIGYSQSAYNTWDSTDQQKFKFFPMENPDGSVVPNTFIVTTTEWNAPIGYDFHNIVAIISNVKAAPNAAGAPVESLTSSDFAPDTTNMLFSTIQINPTPPILQADGTYHTPVTNVVHNTDTLAINNTGDTPLVINLLVLSSKAWQIVNAPAAGTSIAPGGTLDVTIQFVATTEPAHSYNETNSTYNPNYGGIYSGTLTINSSDPVHPTESVNLEGWWQYQDEHDMEPSLQSIVNVMAGYDTDIAPPNTLDLVQPTNSPVYYGEEVNSPYWTQSDPNTPVNVLALSAWHTESYTDSTGALTTTPQTFGYYPAYTRTITKLITTSGSDAQSFLPHPIINGVEVDENATASFTATGNFGFAVDGYEFSDDSMTPNTGANAQGVGFGTGGGHVLRFYPLRLSTGKLVPDTYIVCLDYNAVPGQNFDFQDGVWIVSGIRPAGIRENDPPAGVAQFATAPAPVNVHAVPGAAGQGGVTLQWAQDPNYTGTVGYNVYRSTSLNGTYTLITPTPLTQIGYTDNSAVPGVVNYYRVTEVDPNGVESAAAGTASYAAPAAPAGLTAISTATGVGLTWTKNTESDLAGYNVYRSVLPTEGFTLLNTDGLLTSPKFSDTSAPGGVTSYYLVTAVDNLGNEGASSSASAVSGSGPYTGAPSAVTGLTAKSSDAAVTLSWQEEVAAYMAGYNVYSSTSATGPFTLLNTAGPLSVGTTTYKDATAKTGVPMYYQVVAVDIFGNTSPPASASGTVLPVPAAPAGLGATASAAGISLTWSAVPGAAGYNVYRSTAANGTFTLLNTAGPLTTAAYLDASPPLGVTSYYQVCTVDSAGDLSSAALANAFLAKPPAAPAGLAADPLISGDVTFSWTANTESDLAGYNIYRSGSASGPFTLLNTSGLLTTPAYTDTSAAPGTTCYYQVLAVDTLGRVSPPAAVTVYTLVPPAPATPSGVEATAPVSGGVLLTWNANTELDLAGYNVYRGASATGTFTLLNTGGLLTTTSYTDSTTSPDTAYFYKVVATDTLTRVSPPALVNVTTPLPPTLAAPAGLQAAVFTSAITLSWHANTEGDVAGYKVLRATSPGGPFVQISPGSVQTATYLIDTGAPIGTPSYYEVFAVDAYGHVSPAATISATRPATPPAAPSGLSAVGSVKSVTLKWNANTEANLAGYQVFRASSLNGVYQQINGGVQTGTSYVDANAPAGVVSYYQVRAVNQFGMVSSPAATSAERLPANTPPAAPVGFAASAVVAGVTLTWDAATGPAADDVAGYYVYRCYSAHGHYNKLNAKPLSAGTHEFVDTTATAKVKVYYEVVAVSPTGVLSAPAWLSTTRPAAPKVAKAVKRK